MLLIHTETKVSAIPQTDPGPDELDKAQRHYVIPCYLSSLKIELVAKSLVNLRQIIFRQSWIWTTWVSENISCELDAQTDVPFSRG